MRSTRSSARPDPISPPNTRSRARARTEAKVTGKRRRPPSPSCDSESSDDEQEAEAARRRSLSRSRSLSVIPTSAMPPLTLPAPEDAAVRALGLSQSARPGAAPLSLEYEHLVRMREGHFYRPRPAESTAEAPRDWDALSTSEAAWIRLEEVGVVNKGRSWTSRVGLDEEGDPVKPDLPYVILTKLVIASSPRKMLTLNQAMEERWPYFRVLGQTFRNSIRHNLSMNPAFVNVERPAAEGVGTGKGGYWRVSEDLTEQKTTSHRGRAKKPRVGRARGGQGHAPFVSPVQSEFAPPEFFSPQAHYSYQHTPQPAFSPPPQHAYSPPPSGAYAGYATPPPPRAEAPKPRRRQPPRGKRALEAEEPDAHDAASAPGLSTPASTGASADTGVHLSVPVGSAPPAAPPEYAAPSPFRYPGLTLQRAESFVRGSAPESPPKLPTPPSEAALHAGYGAGWGGYVRVSGERGQKLPGIAALLGPLSPHSSPSVTPTHPA